MLTRVGSPKRVINCTVVTLCLHAASTESRTVQSTCHDLGKGRSPTRVVTVAAMSGGVHTTSNTTRARSPRGQGSVPDGASTLERNAQPERIHSEPTPQQAVSAAGRSARNVASSCLAFMPTGGKP